MVVLGHDFYHPDLGESYIWMQLLNHVVKKEKTVLLKEMCCTVWQLCSLSTSSPQLPVSPKPVCLLVPQL